MILKIHWDNSNSEYLYLVLYLYFECQGLIIKYKVTLQTHVRIIVDRLTDACIIPGRPAVTFQKDNNLNTWINSKYSYLLRHRIKGDIDEV